MREIIRDFLPRRQQPREREDLFRFLEEPRRERESSFRLRATEKEEPRRGSIAVSSRSHGEGVSPFVEEPQRERQSPFSETKMESFREKPNKPNTRSSSLLSSRLHVSPKDGLHRPQIKNGFSDI